MANNSHTALSQSFDQDNITCISTQAIKSRLDRRREREREREKETNKAVKRSLVGEFPYQLVPSDGSSDLL